MAGGPLHFRETIEVRHFRRSAMSPTLYVLDRPDPPHPAVDAVNDAVRLAQEGSLDEAVIRLTAVGARFRGDQARDARRSVVSALLNKGAVLHALGREADALKALESATDRFA